MPLTDLNKITTHTGLDYKVAQKVEQYADEAEVMVRKWIGETKYNEVAADTAHTYYTKVQKAESLLAWAIALPVLNMHIREKGGLVKSTGFAESSNQIMGKWELDGYSRNLFARARQLLRKLLLASTYTERPEEYLR